jgi:hypothetical protein
MFEVGVMRFLPVVRTVSWFMPLATAALIAGCSSDALKNLGATSTATPAATNKTAAGVTSPDTDVDCPTVQIRNGASTWQVPSGASTTDLQYQASLGQTARECALLGDTMTIKVGIEGRLLTGPKGKSGTVEVPLRLALVQEGPKPKSIWTKFYPVRVDIQPGQSGAAFTQVEDDLTFAMPADKDIAAYVIYVGFDPQGLAKKKPVHHPAPKTAAKPKPKKKIAAPAAPPPPSAFAPPSSGSFAPPANSGGTFAPPASGGGGFAPPAGQFSPPPAQQQ